MLSLIPLIHVTATCRPSFGEFTIKQCGSKRGIDTWKDCDGSISMVRVANNFFPKFSLASIGPVLKAISNIVKLSGEIRLCDYDKKSTLNQQTAYVISTINNNTVKAERNKYLSQSLICYSKLNLILDDLNSGQHKILSVINYDLEIRELAHELQLIEAVRRISAGPTPHPLYYSMAGNNYTYVQPVAIAYDNLSNVDELTITHCVISSLIISKKSSDISEISCRTYWSSTPIEIIQLHIRNASQNILIDKDYKFDHLKNFTPLGDGSKQGVSPVMLTKFDVRMTADKKIELIWVTDAESVNKGFGIERKVSGNDKFEQVGFVNSQATGGNSVAQLHYTFIDQAPMRSGNVYYRLAHVDLDGKIDYSEVKLIRFGEHSNSQPYPNPSCGIINVLRPDFIARMKVRLFHSTGKLIQEYNDIRDSHFRIYIDHPGLYNIVILDGLGELVTTQWVLNR